MEGDEYVDSSSASGIRLFCWEFTVTFFICIWLVL